MCVCVCFVGFTAPFFEWAGRGEAEEEAEEEDEGGEEEEETGNGDRPTSSARMKKYGVSAHPLTLMNACPGLPAV